MKDYGIIEYIISDGRSIFLTLVAEEDEDVLLTKGITALRRLRIRRLLKEAASQGYKLSIKELSELLYVSKSTICRDLHYLKSKSLLEMNEVVSVNVGTKQEYDEENI